MTSKIKQYAKPTAEENARCKVCFKKFQDGEFFKLCSTCERKVCDDCSASYGAQMEQKEVTSQPEVTTLYESTKNDAEGSNSKPRFWGPS